MMEKKKKECVGILTKKNKWGIRKILPLELCKNALNLVMMRWINAKEMRIEKESQCDDVDGYFVKSHKVAVGYLKSGQYEKGKEIYEEMIARCRNDTSSSAPSDDKENSRLVLGSLLRNLAKVHILMKDFNSSSSIWNTAVSVGKDSHFESTLHHPEMTSCYNEMGLALFAQKKYERAMDIFTKLVSAFETKQQTPGDNIIQFECAMKALTNTGVTHFALGHYQSALMVFDKLLSINRCALLGGHSSPHGSCSFSSLPLLRTMGHWEDTHMTFRVIARTLCNMACVHLCLKDEELAILELSESLLIRRTVLLFRNEEEDRWSRMATRMLDRLCEKIKK